MQLDKIYLTQYYDIDLLRKAGYNKFKITVTLDVKKIDDGYRHIFFFSSDETNDKYCLNGADGHQFEIGSDKKITSYVKYSFTETISNRELKEYLYIRYEASGKFEDTWVNKNVLVNITPIK